MFDAAGIKQLGRDLGADIVGIASADTLNSHPPDPRFPQIPERISPHCKSVVVIVNRIPAATFRCRNSATVAFQTSAVLRRMDRIAFKLADTMERHGHPSFIVACQETNWNFKNGTYGYLSTRHLGIEAGLGTLGLGVNILTPEFGPRVYLTGILTELELEPDHIRTEQICIGEGCSRCLYGCPTDAVNHFGLNKARCLTKAQEFGFAPMIKFFSEYIAADRDAKRALLQSCEAFGLLQAMQRVVGLYGSCPRCHATCPIGHDYRAFLGDAQKVIPEKTGEKITKGKAMRNARVTGQAIAGLNDWNIRWVGPDGYSGTATRKHFKEFKRCQQRAASANANLSDSGGTTGTSAMDTICRRPLAAEEIKDKARELGADLVGIADGATMEITPPDPQDPRRPSDITRHDGKRAIVLAKRLNYGTTRLSGWYDRHKFYNDELTLTALEEIALELSLWLEDQGCPTLMVPPTMIEPQHYQGNPETPSKPILSASHAAVEAGLGTLGLNLQLITPEYGPRVLLMVVLSSVEVTADCKLETALCLGPACGRCLKACPGDVVGHWERDFAACDRYRSPHGYHKMLSFLEQVIDADDPETQKAMLRTEDSFKLWQSMQRGVGVITGCRRCQDVCPVGSDYDPMLKEVLEFVPECTPVKEARLTEFIGSPKPPAYALQERWIGKL